MTDAVKPTLHTKLAQVMYEVGRIPKNGTAPSSMGGYKFVEVGDAADAIRKALADKSITMMPTAIQVISEAEHQTKSGGTMTTLTVRMDWTITDGVTGETIVLQSIGTGSDSGDKFASKASTSAMKYALLTGFLLSTGEDTENHDTSDRQTAPRPPQTPATPSAPSGPPNRPPLIRETGSDGLVGKVATSGTQDMNLRETPEGLVLPFRLKEGNRAGQIVIAHDAVAEALYAIKDVVMGQTVTVWGRYEDLDNAKPDGTVITFKVLHLSRIKTPDVIIPPEPDTVSAPMFRDDDLSDLPGYQ